MSTLAGRTHLAVRALQVLARRAEGTSVDSVAAALEATPDVVLDILAPLAHAGWVERSAGGPDAFRYMRPIPAPTLHDVVEAVEGSTPIDDYVLRPGISCAGFRTAPVCVAHADWLRELNASALVAIPLAALLRATGPGPGSTPGTKGSRLSAFAEPHGDGCETRIGGEPEPPGPFEVALESAPVAQGDDRIRAAQVPPC